MLSETDAEPLKYNKMYAAKQVAGGLKEWVLTIFM